MVNASSVFRSGKAGAAQPLVGRDGQRRESAFHKISPEQNQRSDSDSAAEIRISGLAPVSPIQCLRRFPVSPRRTQVIS